MDSHNRLKGDNLNSARIIESHSQTGNRTLDEQSARSAASTDILKPSRTSKGKRSKSTLLRCEPQPARSVEMLTVGKRSSW